MISRGVRGRSVGTLVAAVVLALVLGGCASCDCEAEVDWVVGELDRVTRVAVVEVVSVLPVGDGEVAERRLVLSPLEDPVVVRDTGVVVEDEREALTAVQDRYARELQVGDRATVALGLGGTVIVLRDGELPSWWSRRDLLERVLASAVEIDGRTPTEVLVELVVDAREASDADGTTAGPLLVEAMRSAGVEGADDADRTDQP